MHIIEKLSSLISLPIEILTQQQSPLEQLPGLLSSASSHYYTHFEKHWLRKDKESMLIVPVSIDMDYLPPPNFSIRENYLEEKIRWSSRSYGDPNKLCWWWPACELKLSSSSAEHPTIFSASSLKTETKASPLLLATLIGNKMKISRRVQSILLQSSTLIPTPYVKGKLMACYLKLHSS